MVEIPLLEQAVLLETVRALPADDDLVMLNRTPREDWTEGQVVVWEILQDSNQMGRPNGPNAEAHIIPDTGRRQGQATMIYFREKKVLTPTFTLWVRGESRGDLQKATEAIAKALGQLNGRMNYLMEYCIWAALKGSLNLDFPDIVAEVDYGMPASHRPTPATGWDVATPQQIIENVNAWKTLIEAHGRVQANEVYSTTNTLRMIVDAFLRGGDSPGGLFTDRMRDEYWSTGMVNGFMNLDWHPVTKTWQDADGNLQTFLPEGALLLGNFDTGQPLRMFQGRTADFDAPVDHVGPFSKTYRREDPSKQQILLENSFVPVIQRPTNFVYVPSVTG